MNRVSMICLLVFSLLFLTAGNKTEVRLEEVPELGYSYCPESYICYKDILILGEDVYYKEKGSYIKTDKTIYDMLGVEDNSTINYRQYKNLIIRCDEKKFILYDMDTNMSSNYLVQDASEDLNIFNWYLHKGYLYYRISSVNEIRRINLSDWQEQVVYNSEKDGMGIREFAIRSDGKILCEWWNSNKREYYLIELYDNGEWKEKKIWETDGDRWKYVEWHRFNQYGLFQVAEYSDIKFSTEHSVWTSDEGIIIRENGTVESYDIGMNGGWILYLDTGYLVSSIPYSEEVLDEDKEYLLDRHVSGLVFYDYAGNVKRTYQLVDPAILQDKYGYYIKELLYHNEKIIAIYEQENSGKLYIVQVEAEGL